MRCVDRTVSNIDGPADLQNDAIPIRLEARSGVEVGRARPFEAR